MFGPAPIAAGGWAANAVEAGGYPALGGLLVAENLFPPIPSEAILPLAGYFVSQGTLGFVPALLIATLGSVVGAVILYALGRFGGRPLLERWGKVLRLDQKTLDRGDAWFDRHGSWVVLFGRVIPGVRSIVSIPAGASEMPVGRFLALTTLGSGVWNAALIGTGVALGDNWDAVEGVVGPISRVVLVVLVLAVVAGLVWLFTRRRSDGEPA